MNTIMDVIHHHQAAREAKLLQANREELKERPYLSLRMELAPPSSARSCLRPVTPRLQAVLRTRPSTSTRWMRPCWTPSCGSSGSSRFSDFSAMICFAGRFSPDRQQTSLISRVDTISRWFSRTTDRFVLAWWEATRRRPGTHQARKADLPAFPAPATPQEPRARLSCKEPPGSGSPGGL